MHRIQRMRTCLILLGVSMAFTTLYRPGSASATPPEGYKTILLAKGRLGEIDAPGLNAQENDQLWRSMQEIKGPSDVYVQSNVWAPGGSTGWHSHPGHSLIIVTAGTVTNYEGHDPDCKPHVYKTGMGFIDPGGGHVHILRNEGAVEAQTIAVQLIAADAARRIDVADPGNCHF
jgi:quercetin dioxygenase-like cupin family protein